MPPGEGPRPWHAATIAETETELGTGPLGLTEEEAQLRSTILGPNSLPGPERSLPVVLFLRQFTSPLALILIAASGVSLAAGDWVDSAVIGVVLLLNASLGFVQEYRAERSVRALLELAAPRARVIRDGREQEIAGTQLVPGDLVVVESGARIPGDIRLRTATALLIDESALTGESVGVTKSLAPLPPDTVMADRVNLLFAGTMCRSGRGRGYVIAIGRETALGALATAVRQEHRAEPPLHNEMAKLGRVVGLVALGAAGLAFGLGIITGQAPATMFIVAVALAVSSVPEGLPIASTITLALGVRRMAGHKAVVRRLASVETLGSTTVIGTDKTGTLTQNKMTVEAIWAGGQYYAPAEAPLDGATGLSAPTLTHHLALRSTLVTGILTSEAEVYQAGARDESRGDPTEVALLLVARTVGLEPEIVRAEAVEEARVPFEPDLRYSATVHRTGGRRLLLVKGAPERVIAMTTPSPDSHAEHKRQATLQGVVSHLADRGLRVLAMAHRELPEDADPEEAVNHPGQLTLAGFQGMADPPRKEVPAAIARCQRAGIRVVMVTGDHAGTARTIAKRVGILGEGGMVVTGQELEAMAPAQLETVVGSAAVFARVGPEQKLAIVHSLKRRGEIVAITGDGVNDAPALKAASIGVAMGQSGTDAAREAADIVLTDDNFVSIAAAVEEGRVTFANIRKVTLFLLSTNAAEVLALLAALALGWPLPLIAIQLLWLNLVSEGIQHVALAFEPGEGHVMQRHPRRPKSGILTPELWRRLLLAAVVQAAGTLALFRHELLSGASLLTAQTVALTTMVLFQTFQIGNCRSEHRSAFAVSPFSNPFLVLAAGAALLLHIVALYLPLTQRVLGVAPLSLGAWARMAAVAFSVIIAVELDKRVHRKRSRRRGHPPRVAGDAPSPAS
jgi:Ca2+-transporting ATPase